MLSVVYDTNIYVSAMVIDSQIVELIKLAKDQTFNLYISPHVLEEFREVMTDKFETPLSIQKVIFRRIKYITTPTYPTSNLQIIPNNHPDNQILSTCNSCQADYLVTGDKKHLLPLQKFGHTRIVTAQEFMDIISS